MTVTLASALTLTLATLPTAMGTTPPLQVAVSDHCTLPDSDADVVCERTKGAASRRAARMANALSNQAGQQRKEAQHHRTMGAFRA